MRRDNVNNSEVLSGLAFILYLLIYIFIGGSSIFNVIPGIMLIISRIRWLESPSTRLGSIEYNFTIMILAILWIIFTVYEKGN